MSESQNLPRLLAAMGASVDQEAANQERLAELVTELRMTNEHLLEIRSGWFACKLGLITVVLGVALSFIVDIISGLLLLRPQLKNGASILAGALAVALVFMSFEAAKKREWSRRSARRLGLAPRDASN